MKATKTHKTIGELFASGKEITAAMRRAVRAATATKASRSRRKPVASKPATRRARRAA